MFRWILDTRTLWPGDFESQAKTYLQLLKPSDREAVLRYYHAKDRALSLGSCLSKYHAVARVTGLPWDSIVISRDAQHKPCYVPSKADAATLQFNVSHQAGIVALVACPGDARRVGIDVTCVHERDEYKDIDRDGFDSWVAVYAEVFSAREVEDITYHLPSLTLPDGRVLSAAELGDAARCCRRNQTLVVKVLDDDDEEDIEMRISSNELMEAKLRRFYTFWALKEAYVKMTGEALVADWLRLLEFRNVRAPRPGNTTRANSTIAPSTSNNARWGEVIQDIEVWLKGEQVQDVLLEVQAFEKNYILATAVSRSLLLDGQRKMKMKMKKAEAVSRGTMLDAEKVMLDGQKKTEGIEQQTEKEGSEKRKDANEEEQEAEEEAEELPPFEDLVLERDILPDASSSRN